MTTTKMEPFELTDDVKASVDRILEACETLDRRVSRAAQLMGRVVTRLEKLDAKPAAAKVEVARSKTQKIRRSSRKSAPRQSLSVHNK